MFNRKILISAILILFIINILLFFPQKRIISFNTLSTIANITVKKINLIQFVKLRKEIINYCNDFEKKYSVTKNSSMVSKLNSSKNIQLTDPVFNTMIFNSIKLSEQTGGEFDITVKPLISIWGFDTDFPDKPAETDIEKALLKTGFKNIQIKNNQIFLQNNAEITLGGIAKGMLIDILYSFMTEHFSEFLIEIGGDIRVYSHSENKKFKIGIKHADSKGILEVIELESGQAVATSGNYERFFKDENNDVFHHILSPLTGFPVNYYKQVTVVAQNCMTADMLSTAFFMLDKQKIKQISDIYGVDYIKIVDNEKMN